MKQLKQTPRSILHPPVSVLEEILMEISAGTAAVTSEKVSRLMLMFCKNNSYSLLNILFRKPIQNPYMIFFSNFTNNLCTDSQVFSSKFPLEFIQGLICNSFIGFLLGALNIFVRGFSGNYQTISGIMWRSSSILH